MKSFPITVLTTFLTTSVAMAECAKPEDNLFTCTFEEGKKTVELCMEGGNPLPKVSYKFGKTGEKPELELSKSFKQYEDQKSPTEGYFAANWEEHAVHIGQGEFNYSLVELPNFETTETEQQETYHLFVSKDDEATKEDDYECDGNSHSGSMQPLFDALHAKNINTEIS